MRSMLTVQSLGILILCWLTAFEAVKSSSSSLECQATGTCALDESGFLQIHNGQANAQTKEVRGKAITKVKYGGKVTLQNFALAEVTQFFNEYVVDGDHPGLGQFFMAPHPAPPTYKVNPRMNRDTLYGKMVADLQASPVEIGFPEARDGRYQSLLVLSQENDVFPTIYKPGVHRFTMQDLGTRYALFLVRVFMMADNETDIHLANSLQQRWNVTQTNKGDYEKTTWDNESHVEIKHALTTLLRHNNDTLNPTANMFGLRKDLDPLNYLMGTACCFGRQQEKDAVMIYVHPASAVNATPTSLTVSNVPIVSNGFWSVTTYDKDGFFQGEGPYSFNDWTAKCNTDGSFTLNFGGCDDKSRLNCMPIAGPGWNYNVRIYRPGEAILNGTWHFPTAP